MSHFVDDDLSEFEVGEEAAEEDAGMLREHAQVGEHGQGLAQAKRIEKVVEEPENDGGRQGHDYKAERDDEERYGETASPETMNYVDNSPTFRIESSFDEQGIEYHHGCERYEIVDNHVNAVPHW